MKIKIDDKNADKINAALDAVNGKASAFTVRFFTDIKWLADRAEKRLEASNLPKASRAGVEVSYTPAGPETKAYKYAAKSTTVRILRGSSCWYLTGVSETSVYPKSAEHFLTSITPDQRDIITAKALASYRVITPAQDEAAA